MTREYTVVGAGAIGGTLAWHLARAGHPVTVVDADPAHVAAIARHGIVLERGGVREAQPVAAAGLVLENASNTEAVGTGLTYTGGASSSVGR